MSNHTTGCVGAVLVVLSSGLCPPRAALADTLIVPRDFPTIQAAIDAAEPADLVMVEPGRYEENLRLRSGIDVSGQETARTLLAPEDDSRPTVAIAGVLRSRLSNLTLVDSTIGVAVSQSSGVDVANLVFDQVSQTGVATDAVSSVRIVNDVFYMGGTAIARGAAATEVGNDIFAGNAATITTSLALADPYINVGPDCFFMNRDLAAAGVDSGAGTGAVVADPLFVEPAVRDFHLRQGSPCIDTGRGIDVIDQTTADIGAYGGPYADASPFPVAEPALQTAAGGQPGSYAIEASWPANLSYRVSSATNPGGYRVYYRQGGAPSSNDPAEYNGLEAGGGMLPSPVEVGNVTSYTLSGLSPEPSAPLAPRLSSAEGRDAAVALRWDSVPSATGYRVYYGTAAVTEHVIDAGDATSYTVSGLANGTAYRFAVSAVQQAMYAVAVSVVDNTQYRHESALSPPATMGFGAPAESALSQTSTATPARIAPYPDLPDQSNCFIASAAFGAGWAPELLALRDFRDRFLLPYTPGRWLARKYYGLSPAAARFLHRHAYLKPAVRALLWPLVVLTLVMLEGSGTIWAVLLALVGAEIALRLRIRRLAAEFEARAADDPP
ncbi:MAG TPA: fibronectin type III domain-containing protein [Gammaproteobacteria bacterium]|nr:fibronectin type III domain-containing protein [Gammaproteobacteria bacterium]